MLPVTYDPLFDLAPCFPGMLADSGFTDKLTHPCGATPQPFGTVVATVPATGISVLPIGTNTLQGVAIHDQTVAGRIVSQDGYIRGDAMSVIAEGRIWARASGTCTKDAPAKFDPATGMFSDAGTATYPRARFLTGQVSVIGVLSTDAATIAVQVELMNTSAA